MLIKNKDDLLDFVGTVQAALEKGHLVELDYAVQGEKRTLEQNKKSWAMYRDLSEQVLWNNEKLSIFQWKDLLTVGFLREDMQDDGAWNSQWKYGLSGDYCVFIGQKTSEMGKAQFVRYVEFIYYFAASYENFRWSITSEEIFKSYGITVE